MRSLLDKLDPMSVGVGEDCAATPLGILGWRNHCPGIVDKCCDYRVQGRNGETDASAERGRPIGRERIELEDAATKFCSVVLRAAAVLVLSKLQTQPRVERRCPRQVGRT